MTAYLVTGGAGFIGSHVVRRLAADPDGARHGVRQPHLRAAASTSTALLDDGRVEIVEGDLKDLEAIVAAIEGVDHAFHFAANPDIAKAMADPSVDFWEGTYLTQNLLEAMRRGGVPRLTYASGQRRLRRRRRAAGARRTCRCGRSPPTAPRSSAARR